MNKILEIQDLEMNYVTKEERVRVINDVSFYVKEGETFGLVGESGCGKSTICHSILQLLPPSAKFLNGSIRYKGEELLGKTEKQMQKIRGREISISFQQLMTALNPVTTMEEQIFEQYRDLNISKEEKREKALTMLRLVGIPSPEQRLKEYVHQFSGGMRQRMMIAIALAANPKLLLADEPTTALDVTIQDQILKLLCELKETLDMSIILVTHDLGVVSQMCDRVAVMYAGYIVETADTLTLFSKPHTRSRVADPIHAPGRRQQEQAHLHPRRAAQPQPTARGLPVPPPVSIRQRPVQKRTARPERGGARPLCPVPSYRRADRPPRPDRRGRERGVTP